MDVLITITNILYVTETIINFLSSLKKAKKLRKTRFSNLPFRAIQYIDVLRNIDI